MFGRNKATQDDREFAKWLRRHADTLGAVPGDRDWNKDRKRETKRDARHIRRGDR